MFGHVDHAGVGTQCIGGARMLAGAAVAIVGGLVSGWDVATGGVEAPVVVSVDLGGDSRLRCDGEGSGEIR